MTSGALRHLHSPDEWGKGSQVGGGMHFGLSVKAPTAAWPQTLLQLKNQQKECIFVFCSGTVGACLSSISRYQSSASFGLAGPGADPVPKSLTQTT